MERFQLKWLLQHYDPLILKHYWQNVFQIAHLYSIHLLLFCSYHDRKSKKKGQSSNLPAFSWIIVPNHIILWFSRDRNAFDSKDLKINYFLIRIRAGWLERSTIKMTMSFRPLEDFRKTIQDERLSVFLMLEIH